MRIGFLQGRTIDEKTLAQAQAGDRMAFAGLVTAYQGMVFGAAYHFLRNMALAEEVAQDVFFELYRRMRSIDSPEHLKAWLCRAAMCRCIDQSRRKRNRTEVPLEEYHRAPATGNEYGDVLAGDWIRRQVATLPDAQRAVVILRYQEDFDPAEIAELLDIPLNTVKSRLHRALEALRVRWPRARKEAV